MKAQRLVEISFYVACTLLLAWLKWLALGLDNSFYIVFLWPTAKLSGLFSAMSFHASEFGFLAESANIVIDKSCSGLNFFILSFIVFLFAKTWRPKTILSSLLGLLLALVCSYLLTTFANSVRITLSIFTSNLNAAYAEGVFHRGLGIFVYLSFLILYYQILIFVRDRYDYQQFFKRLIA